MALANFHRYLPFAIFICAIVPAICDVVTPYRVFRISPRSWEDMRSINKLRRTLSEENEVDFWKDAQRPRQFTDVMVAPFALSKFERFMHHHNLNYTIAVHDVERLIRSNEAKSFSDYGKVCLSADGKECGQTHLKNNNEEVRQFLRSRLRDEQRAETAAAEFENFEKSSMEKVGDLRATYPFGMYTGYAAMIRYIRMLDFYYPHIARVVQIGKTHEGRSIEGIMIGYPVNNNTKRIFWIDGNMHAREWASSHTALFIINQLVSGYDKNPEITHYLNSINFLIVPCANPDGFEYSRSSMKPQIRLWRKNRSPEQCVPSVWGGVRCCQGVDLNRNFDFHWAETGSSSNPCSNLYAGSGAFSEPESRAMADFLTAPQLVGRVDAFITLHTYAQMWIHPYSHQLNAIPNDYDKLRDVAKLAVERISKVYGTRYRIGTGADLLSPASGGSDDWAKDKLGVKFVYLVELRPQLELSQGFILKQEELIPTAIETFEGVKAVIDSVLEYNDLSQRKKVGSRQFHRISVPTTTPSTKATVQTTLQIFAENDMIDPRDGNINFMSAVDDTNSSIPFPRPIGKTLAPYVNWTANEGVMLPSTLDPKKNEDRLTDVTESLVRSTVVVLRESNKTTSTTTETATTMSETTTESTTTADVAETTSLVKDLQMSTTTSDLTFSTELSSPTESPSSTELVTKKLVDWLTTSVLYTATDAPIEELKEAAIPTTKPPILHYASRFFTRPIAPLTQSAPFVNAPIESDPSLTAAGENNNSLLRRTFGVSTHNNRTAAANSVSQKNQPKSADNIVKSPKKDTGATLAMVVAPLYGSLDSAIIARPQMDNSYK